MTSFNLVRRSGFKLRRLTAFLITLSLIQACASSTIDPQNLKKQIDALYPNQSEEIRAFFAQEAFIADVQFIHKMKRGEKHRIIYSHQTGCGGSELDTRSLVINPRKEQCLRLSHLAHEIAHIAVLRLDCYGHGDKFYQYNLDIARRFEQQFPDVADRGGWNVPVQNVENRSKYYRSDAESCL
jgi:hypothetical protein